MLFLKFLWSKKSYVIIILISIILISILAIKLALSERSLTKLNNEIAQNAEVQKLNENIYSQLVFMTENFDSSKEIKKYIKGDSIIQIKNVYKPASKSVVLTASTLDNEGTSTEPGLCVESKKTFNYSDDFQDLKYDVFGVESHVDIKYKPITIETVISKKNGAYQAYFNTSNKNLILESSSVKFDKSTFKRNKNNILNASLNYNLNKFTTDNKYTGIGIGVEYIRIFDAVPITVGVNYNIDLEGNNRVGLLLGGRF